MQKQSPEGFLKEGFMTNFEFTKKTTVPESLFDKVKNSVDFQLNMVFIADSRTGFCSGLVFALNH